MASIKMVWVQCCICKGTRVERGIRRIHANGATTWEPFDEECTNCGGDGGHRVPVLAPDPEKTTSTQRPAWWEPSPKDPWNDPAYD